MLHKTSQVQGYHLVADDGEIGHIDDFLVDEGSWAVRFLVVDTSNWIGGQSVLISPRVIRAIDSPKKQVHITLTRDQVKQSPSVNVADIDPAETLPSVILL